MYMSGVADSLWVLRLSVYTPRYQGLCGGKILRITRVFRCCDVGIRFSVYTLPNYCLYGRKILRPRLLCHVRFSLSSLLFRFYPFFFSYINRLLSLGVTIFSYSVYDRKISPISPFISRCDDFLLFCLRTQSFSYLPFLSLGVTIFSILSPDAKIFLSHLFFPSVYQSPFLCTCKIFSLRRKIFPTSLV